jgi:high-affinity Fe2+/Pb2+ permease
MPDSEYHSSDHFASGQFASHQYARPTSAVPPAYSAARAGARRTIAIGVAVFVVGVAITVGTFESARHGGTYFVAYGAIVMGPVRIWRGLRRLGRIPRQMG